MAASGGKGDAKDAKPDSAAASNAVDGLTPPTMKYGNDSDGERTQIGPAPSGISKPASTPGSRPSAASATITGDMTGASHAPSATSIGAQDLSQERLLRDAPRVESNGQQCPSLNGIPLLAKIGQGGMGAVYFGVHPRLQSEVAVKVLPFHLAEQDPGMIKRFFREAQIAAMVRSPHLVNVMDVNEESGLFFLVMEFVPGRTAGQYLKMVLEGDSTKIGMPEREALDIIIAATIGLQAAHNNNIVHRDLKPENIMVPYLSRNSAKEFDLRRSKLMDLGLARNEESNQSLTGVQAAMGTPGYMAPEQALDAKTADKRSDIFGMGATIYALLTGKPPFRGEAIMKVLMATMHEPHEPITKVRPDVSQAFSDIIDKCLDKKQDNRYPDATHLLKALRHCRKLVAPADGEDDDDEGGGDVGVVPGMSMARQVAAGGGQPTLIAGGGEATLITGAPGAKSKTGMYVAGAAAVLILAGGLGFAFMKKGGDTGNVVSGTGTSTGTGTGPGKIDPGPPKIQLSDKLITLQKNMHANNLKLAEDSAKAGDLDSAMSFMLTAHSLPLKNIDDPALMKVLDAEEKRVQTVLDNAGKTIKFSEKLQLVDNYIKKQDLTKAKTELTGATEFAVDEATMKSLAEKQKLMTFLNTAEIKRKAFVEILGKAAEALKKPETVTDDAMKALNDAQVKLPSDDDRAKLQREAPYLIPPADEFTALQKKFAAILDERQKNESYDRLLKQAKETTNLDTKATLLQQAIDLGLDRNEAKTAKVDIDNQLGAAKVKEREAARKAELKKDFETAFKDAQDLNEKKDYDKALVSLNKALAKIPDDPLAKQLEKDLNAAIDLKKKNVEFHNLLLAASAALEESDTASAEKSLADARKFFDKDPDLQKLEKSVADTKLRIKNKKEYDGYSQAARKAIPDNDTAKAQENYDKALAIDPKGPGLDGVRDFLNQKQSEKLAADAKMEKFKKFMDEAAKIETGVDGKPAEVQVTELKKALDSYTSAKMYAPDADKSAAEKTSAVKAKLDTATAAWEKEKAAAALKVKFDGIRKTFETKLPDIVKNGATSPDDAIAALNAFKVDMTDKDAFKTELGKIDTQIAEFNKVVLAQAEGKYKAVMQQVKDKLSAKELNGALTALRGVPPSFAAQQDVKDLNLALATIQNVSNDISTLVNNSTARLEKLNRVLKPGKGDAEKARYNTAVANVQALPNAAMAQLAAANLKDAGVTSKLKKDKEIIADDIGNALDRLDTISHEAPPPPPRVDPPPRDPQPKKKESGGVGEQNVDD